MEIECPDVQRATAAVLQLKRRKGKQRLKPKQAEGKEK